MPGNTNYLEITIGNQQVQVTDPEELPFSIDYKLEDEEDFQQKKGSEAVQITFPATLFNAKTANSYEQGFEDMSEGEIFKGFQPVRVKHNGYELLLGKSVLDEAGETDKPESYTFDIYGDNSDWIIALKESTLFDFLKHIKFLFTKQLIIDSWQYDGTLESLPYVFAPVRYGLAMGELKVDNDLLTDYNMLPEYMKPSLSKYWIIYWAFKSVGYRIDSEFFNTNYFRRQVMPWTWGNFQFSEGTRIENLKFMAKSAAEMSITQNYNDYWDLGVTNDSTDGAFDNNNTYTYDSSTKAMTWTYLPAFNYGALDATFHISVFVDALASDDGDVVLRVLWYKNNQLISDGGEFTLVELHGPAVGKRFDIGNKESWVTVRVNPNDKITAKLHLVTNQGGIVGKGEIKAKVDAFEFAYFRIPIGGTIDFANYASLKKIKFLDFLRGVVDEFDLSIKTDTISKVVLMEPAHDYKLPGEASVRKGFFNGDFIDWNNKQDLSKFSKKILFNEYEREVIFRYKDDSADGLQKKVQDRNSNIIAAAKYVLPDRFKAGKKEHENRFFSPTIHYSVDQWAHITGTAPQMVTMVPENISNTAKDEAQNTFLAKSCYYKGVIPGMGWVFDGENKVSFPFMFAVNYMAGGENDPVLSYSDERIAEKKVAKGLFKTFFAQRMAIMREGAWYNTWFKLNDYDVASEMHREFKVCRNQRWELIAIYNYSPLKEITTNVLMRKWVPVSYEDVDRTYPSESSVLNKGTVLNFDTKYSPLKALASDIPK
jgi:hypothetical protein